MISTYQLLLLVHVLAFVYWLGADLGVLYAARFGADERLSLETRQTIGDIMSFVDLFPRLSVPTIGATGITMAYLSGGLSINEFWIGFVWVAAFLWISSNVFVYVNRSRRNRIRAVMQFDTWWRIVLLVAIGGVAIASFLGVGITSSYSLAAKLLILAMAIALSLVLRFLFKPYRPALERLAAGGENSKNSAIMNRALTRARPIVLVIWLFTVAAAAIGLWMPF